MEGYIYILTNRYVPKLVKLGHTDRDPKVRAEELSTTTGVPGRWEVFHSWHLENAYKCEQRLFNELHSFRETGEFLKLSPQVAKQRIAALLASWGETGSDGLTDLERREFEALQSERLTKAEARERQEVEKKKQEDLIRLFRAIDQQIKESVSVAERGVLEANKERLQGKRLQAAVIWGVVGLVVSLLFVKTDIGPFIITAILAGIAYMMNDGRTALLSSDEMHQARRDAIRGICNKYGLAYIFEPSNSGQLDDRGFRYEGPDKWVPSLDGPKNRITGQRLADGQPIGTGYVPMFYFSPSQRLLVCDELVRPRHSG